MNAQHEPSNDEAEETSRVYLKSALEHMLAAGRSVRDMVEFSLERFGDGAIPQLKRFFDDVQSGEIKINGLPKGARDALFGLQMTAGERHDLVRLAAYVRAEGRGFVGGSPEDDWHAAEQEVEQLLAERIGLVAKGRRALSEAGLAIGREIDDIAGLVSAWLEERSPTRAAGEATGSQAPPAQPAAKKKTAKNQAAKQDVMGEAVQQGAETAAKPVAKGSAKSPGTSGAKKSAKLPEAASAKKRPKKPTKK